MIKHLVVSNFKSIKYLNINCSKINLFIGEPNTGKSNILEVIGVLSHVYHGDLSDFVRYDNMSNMFFDQNLENSISITFDSDELEINYEKGNFVGYHIGEAKRNDAFTYNVQGGGGRSPRPEFEKFKFYRFSILRNFPDQNAIYLKPPNGQNLSSVIMTRKTLRNNITNLFSNFNFRFVIELPEGRIRILKDKVDIVISFPYFLTSDTLQRLVFFLSALYSNKESILSFEEPESHAFPYYTKYLAERIALDKNENQFFISTHNPYLLTSILEKSPKNEVSVFVTYMEEYQTKVKPLDNSDIEDLLGLEFDAIFNIDRFLS